MGFDERPTDLAALGEVEEWMSALLPTRNKPTAVRYGETTVVYWRENDEWTAREFGRPGALPISAELAEVIETDQRRAREKLLD